MVSSGVQGKKIIKIIKKGSWITVMSLISLLMFFPILVMISTSLKSNGELYNIIPKTIHFANYLEMWNRGNWILYFKNTLVIAVVAVGFSLIFNSIAGYAFARLHFPGRKLLFGLLMIGLMLPQQLTLLPTFQMMVKFPLFGGNDIWGQGGTGLYNTFAGILLPMVAGSFGVFFCYQYFLDFPAELDDAIKIDGGNKWEAFWYIYMPNAKPLFATLGLTKFVSSWNSYLWPLIMSNSDKIKTVQMALQSFKQDDSVQWNLLMAGTTLVALPLIVVFLFLQKYFIEGNITAGIK